ncbi:integral membrane protein 2B [Cynoglossus semilaevis]|uniref:Integral membrane protein 2 n=1 Tax=Cynoglossus semilaevis TaxID=244447 RepID=A0A3P8WY49_CYNSE|nr:integral membrane protein 2B [Cynoglossus semilaevis]
MVKVSFSSALTQKEVKWDAKSLLPENTDPEAAKPAVVPVSRQQNQAWCWCMCLGLALMLSGVVVGGVYLFRYYSENGEVFVCGLQYREEDYMIRDEEEEVHVEFSSSHHLYLLEEKIRILQEEQVELINVPVPEFENGDPATIVHDFPRMLTAYLDLTLNKCYVIPLNTSIVLPPKNFQDLLTSIKAEKYFPQTYLVHEEMVVTERLYHVEQLGYYIYNVCRGRETFKLQRRDHILGMQKREVLNCRKIRHFGSMVVVETLICEP